jgi:hypothetical protein
MMTALNDRQLAQINAASALPNGSGDGGLGLHRPLYRQFNFDDAAGRK